MAIRPTLNLAVQGTQINPDPYNENFDMMLSYIDDTIIELNTFVQSQVNSMNNKVTNLRMIGQPIIRLNDILQSDEIRLEGAEVSRETYASLFSIYGTTYGAGNGVTTFNLPDCRKRAFWGDETFGYIEAGLPNITGDFAGSNDYQNSASGAFRRVGTGALAKEGTTHTGGYYTFDASRSSNIYKNDCKTVLTNGLKFRVVTRYK